MKVVRYVLLTLAVALLLSQSVYFEKLSERHKALLLQKFNAADYGADFWQKLQVESERAVEVEHLLELFAADMATAVNRYGCTLDVSRSRSFLVRGQGEIAALTDESLAIRLKSGDPEVVILTDYIFGNDIRDASGLVRVSDFPSTMEFNSISAAINRIVVDEVLPPVVAAAAVGRRIRFVGAATVNDERPEYRPLRVVPIQLQWVDQP